MSHLIKLYTVRKFSYFRLWYLKSKLIPVFLSSQILICLNVLLVKNQALSSITNEIFGIVREDFT